MLRLRFLSELGGWGRRLEMLEIAVRFLLKGLVAEVKLENREEEIDKPVRRPLW